MTTDSALALAIKFHETYERLAPSFGYETRKETRAFDPTTPNGRLMVAVCKELMDYPASASVEVAGAVPRNAGVPTGWHEGVPEIPKGTDRYFIVAVKRKSGKIWTFPATYCNDFGLMTENPKAASGPGWSSRLSEENEDESEFVTGWYSADSSDGEYDNVYMPLLSEGESVLAWQPIPAYALSAAPPPSVATGCGTSKSEPAPSGSSATGEGS